MAVCTSCGNQVEESASFCTSCGKRLEAEPVPVDQAAPAVTTAVPLEAETTAPTASPNPFCTSCGTKIEPGTSFCTNCGQPAAVESTNVAAPETNVVPAA